MAPSAGLSPSVIATLWRLLAHSNRLTVHITSSRLAQLPLFASLVLWHMLKCDYQALFLIKNLIFKYKIVHGTKWLLLNRIKSTIFYTSELTASYNCVELTRLASGCFACIHLSWTRSRADEEWISKQRGYLFINLIYSFIYKFICYNDVKNVNTSTLLIWFSVSWNQESTIRSTVVCFA